MSDPGAARYSWQEIIVGLLFIAILGALTFALTHYVKATRLWKRRQEIFVLFENVGSLNNDAPVRYNGLEIGRVKSLRPVHLDEKLAAARIRTLTRRDINNLPFRSDALKRR